MAKVAVLVEVIAEQENAFAAFEMSAAAPARERVAYAERLGADLSGAGIEFTDAEPPIPMFSEAVIAGQVLGPGGFAAFAESHENPDVAASSTFDVSSRRGVRFAEHR